MHAWIFSHTPTTTRAGSLVYVRVGSGQFRAGQDICGPTDHFQWFWDDCGHKRVMYNSINRGLEAIYIYNLYIMFNHIFDEIWFLLPLLNLTRHLQIFRWLRLWKVSSSLKRIRTTPHEELFNLLTFLIFMFWRLDFVIVKSLKQNQLLANLGVVSYQLSIGWKDLIT